MTTSGTATMKIYFCDKCNESIPLKDINSNRITIDAGKIFCQDCAPKPTRAPRSLSAPTTIVVMMLCLALGAAAMVAWGERIFDLSPPASMTERLASVESSLASRLSAHDDEIRAIHADLSETPDASGKQGRISKLVQDVSSTASAVQQVRHGLNALSDDVKTQLEVVRKAQDDARNAAKRDGDDLHALADRLVVDLEKVLNQSRSFEQQVASMTERLAKLEDGRASVVTAPKDVPTTPKVTEDVLTAKEQAAFDRAVAQLKDKEPAKRFAAIFELTQIKGHRVDQILVESLSDEVGYIRSTIVEALQNRGVKWAIPKVIARLKDSDAYVREYAIKALDVLIGRPIGLKPESTPGQFQAKMTELERWWNENKDKILAAE